MTNYENVYGFKRERAIGQSTQKSMQKKLRFGKSSQEERSLNPDPCVSGDFAISPRYGCEFNCLSHRPLHLLTVRFPTQQLCVS